MLSQVEVFAEKVRGLVSAANKFAVGSYVPTEDITQVYGLSSLNGGISRYLSLGFSWALPTSITSD